MDNPVFEASDRGTFIYREWTEPMTGRVYLVESQRMIYNWRLYLTPKDNPMGWDYGWCYKDLATLMFAVPLWDIDTEDEPQGWHKRPTYAKVRQAPLRDQGAGVRCEHGAWATDMDCSFVHCRHWRPDTLPAQESIPEGES